MVIVRFSHRHCEKISQSFSHKEKNDCFGENSCFGLLHSYGGKLINIACNFEVTYLHYVEKKKKISYRYFKKFNGEILDNGKKSFVETRYFVGKKKINYSMDLDKLKKKLIKGKLKNIMTGKVPVDYVMNFFKNQS